MTNAPGRAIVHFLGSELGSYRPRPITTGPAGDGSGSIYGRMAEWLIVPPWKGGIRRFRIEGSNPSPSAKIHELDVQHPGEAGVV